MPDLSGFELLARLDELVRILGALLRALLGAAVALVALGILLVWLLPAVR